MARKLTPRKRKDVNAPVPCVRRDGLLRGTYGKNDTQAHRFTVHEPGTTPRLLHRGFEFFWGPDLPISGRRENQVQVILRPPMRAWGFPGSPNPEHRPVSIRSALRWNALPAAQQRQTAGYVRRRVLTDISEYLIMVRVDRRLYRGPRSFRVERAWHRSRFPPTPPTRARWPPLEPGLRESLALSGPPFV